MYLCKDFTGAYLAAEREEGVSDDLPQILYLLTETLDALYSQVRLFPAEWAVHPSASTASIGGAGALTIQISLSPSRFALLRSAISLAGDIELILRALLGLNLGRIREAIQAMKVQADRFRGIRNYFAHINERLLDPAGRHGVSGTHISPCGVSYTEVVSGGMHLVVSGNCVYYTEENELKEVDVSRESFIALLHSARQLYETCVGHQRWLGTKDFPDFSSFYEFRETLFKPRVERSATGKLTWNWRA